MGIEDTPKPNNPTESKEKIVFKVLYAEDDAYLREVTQIWLERWGYKVNAVENGEELLSQLTDGKFDIIVTDNNMPGITGLQILERLHTGGNDVPIIVLTANDIREKVENLGGVFLSKNTPIQDLRLMLEGVLKKNKNTQ